MALPLAALLAALLALTASAQPGRLSPEDAKASITRDFAKGADLQALDLTDQPGPLVSLLDQAKYVQAGREPGDARETYVAFVRSIARRLGTRSDLAVALYGDRVRQKRGTGAGPSEVDARAAIAEDVKRNPGISTAKKARMARDLLRTSEYLQMGMNGDGDSVTGEGSRPAELIVTRPSLPVERDWTKIPPQVMPLAFSARPTPSPVADLPGASAGAMSWASLTAYFDWEKGKQVAQEAYTGTLNYAKRMGKMCYLFVKQALIDAGVIDAPNPQSVGLIGLRSGAAAMFNQDVKRNPKILDKMGYRQVDLAHVSDVPASVPDGSMLIYAGGCSFADPTNGHAEITVGEQTYEALRSQNKHLTRLSVEANEIRVCHFACTTRSMPFLRTYGKKGCLKMYVPVKSS